MLTKIVKLLFFLRTDKPRHKIIVFPSNVLFIIFNDDFLNYM